jgi:hypothetical protein
MAAPTTLLAVLAAMVRRATMVATCAWKNKFSKKAGVRSITTKPRGSHWAQETHDPWHKGDVVQMPTVGDYPLLIEVRSAEHEAKDQGKGSHARRA